MGVGVLVPVVTCMIGKISKIVFHHEGKDGSSSFLKIFSHEPFYLRRLVKAVFFTASGALQDTLISLLGF
jgi:hypothetical protein